MKPCKPTSLKDLEVFKKARVGWYGHSVEGSEDVELGADQLYTRCKVQAGEPSPEEFNSSRRPICFCFFPSAGTFFPQSSSRLTVAALPEALAARVQGRSWDLPFTTSKRCLD